jgi:hemerythrin
MHRFQFTPELETGNEDIDSQHQTLFAMANEILYSPELEQNPDEFRRAVTFLVSYIEYHFSSEELAMLELKYPSRRFHAAFHDHIRRQAKEIVRNAGRKGEVDETRSAIFFMLEDWAVYHVPGADRQLASYMREQTPTDRKPRLPEIRQRITAPLAAPLSAGAAGQV